MELQTFNTAERPCRRSNPARSDGVWPGGPFYVVGNDIYFHQQDAERRLMELLSKSVVPGDGIEPPNGAM